MRLYKAVTPSRRHLKGISLEFLSSMKPKKSLMLAKISKQGHNHSGRITSRFRGGKGKRLCRNLDLWYALRGRKATRALVLGFFYDPNRSAYLALILYLDGVLYTTKRYIIATEGLQKGDVIRVGKTAPLEVGNVLPLSHIPPGSNVSCVELSPGKGAKVARAAGTKVQLLLTDEKYAAIRLPSKELRLVPKECFAVLGSVNSSFHNKTTKAKAGRNRWLGRRPKVRGGAMNPIDHPHGGGEGRAPIGRKAPFTPWGRPAFGVRTRHNYKPNYKMIIRRRK